jgi:hypothetical protein
MLAKAYAGRSLSPPESRTRNQRAPLRKRIETPAGSFYTKGKWITYPERFKSRFWVSGYANFEMNLIAISAWSIEDQHVKITRHFPSAPIANRPTQI